MADIIDVMIADTYHYTETGKNIAGRMRQWKPINLTKELNCNRPDLWEAFEKPGKVKRIKIKNAAGIALGLFTAGAIALKALNDNKFNFIS